MKKLIFSRKSLILRQMLTNSQIQKHQLSHNFNYINIIKESTYIFSTLIYH